MKRDLIINVLLIIAGIVLAVALFGAGALWRSNDGPTMRRAHAEQEVRR
jgi:hypothetical protein